ncbi:MAG: hypothetical protein ACKOC8_01270 [Pirellulales bacterium]
MPTSHDAPRSVFFLQGCPVCGRRLQVDVALLGRRVYCQHCGGGFVAMDEALQGSGANPAGEVRRDADVLDKADALLAQAAQALARAGSGDEF